MPYSELETKRKITPNRFGAKLCPVNYKPFYSNPRSPHTIRQWWVSIKSLSILPRAYLIAENWTYKDCKKTKILQVKFNIMKSVFILHNKNSPSSTHNRVSRLFWHCVEVTLWFHISPPVPKYELKQARQHKFIQQRTGLRRTTEQPQLLLFGPCDGCLCISINPSHPERMRQEIKTH